MVRQKQTESNGRNQILNGIPLITYNAQPQAKSKKSSQRIHTEIRNHLQTNGRNRSRRRRTTQTHRNQIDTDTRNNKHKRTQRTRLRKLQTKTTNGRNAQRIPGALPNEYHSHRPKIMSQMWRRARTKPQQTTTTPH